MLRPWAIPSTHMSNFHPLPTSNPHAQPDCLPAPQGGIRLNRNPPNLSFRKKKTGGIAINRLLPLTHLDEKMVQRILQVRLPVLTLLCAWEATCTANSTAPCSCVLQKPHLERLEAQQAGGKGGRKG